MSDPLVDGSDTPLADRHDVALLDLDGVLYVGPDAVPGAPEAVRAAAEAGMRPAYVTNNAARTPETVAAHLRELGVPAGPEDVVTSAQAAATLLAGRVPAGSRVLVVGGEGLRRRRPGARAGAGARGRRRRRRGRPGLLAGRRLAAAGRGHVRRRAGLPWIATNMDATVPTPGGTAPGNGLLVGVVARAAGREPDAVAGKPETPLHEESVRRTGREDAAGRRGPAGHRHRRRQPGRRTQPARPHRRLPPGRPAARRAGAAADVPRP